MRPNYNEKEEKVSLKRPEIKKKPSQKVQNQSLKAELREINKQVQERQDQLMSLSHKCRQEGLRNQKLKKQVSEADERLQFFIKKQVAFFFEKYKGNKESPLFNNQNGLSPFELLRIGDQKFENYEPGNICMVCYMDLQKNTKILILPCSHIVHKQCGIQHFLYCQNCPACSQNLKGN